MTNKTRPAPLGATYKRSVRPNWSSLPSDATPNGARRFLFDCGYKDFAPTELGCRIVISGSPSARSYKSHWSHKACRAVGLAEAGPIRATPSRLRLPKPLSLAPRAEILWNN
jgi:hypothetical protein